MKLTNKQKRLLRKFNQPDTHLVVSRFPKKGTEYDGVATYTQDVVTRFAKKYGDKFVVLAERADKQVFELVNENILVIRAFDERRFHLYPQVLTWLNAFPKVKKVYVHSEFCASGGPILRFMVVPFIGLIRLFGKEITFYAHNVVTDLRGYEGHLGTSSYWLKFLSVGYRWYFRLLSLMVSKFVVLEQSVQNRLKQMVGNKLILVEPHWIAPAGVKLTKTQARLKLNLPLKKRIVLSFGFVTHYKGADFMARFAGWLTKQEKSKRTYVVLAGGKAYSLKDKKYYNEYYQKIEQMAAANPQLILTGFLSETQVKLWLKAADLVILPYRNLMGGSGALQQALRHKKPVLMSAPMAEGLGIEDKQFVFKHTFQSLMTVIDKFFEDETFKTGAKSFSHEYARQLSIKYLLPKHYREVYAGTNETEMVDCHETILFQPVQV